MLLPRHTKTCASVTLDGAHSGEGPWPSQRVRATTRARVKVGWGQGKDRRVISSLFGVHVSGLMRGLGLGPGPDPIPDPIPDLIHGHSLGLASAGHGFGQIANPRFTHVP